MNPIQRIETSIVLLGAALLLTAGPAFAACPLADPADCIYVDDNCLDPPFGGFGPQEDPFCQITDAYIEARTNTSPENPAHILVMPGTYSECVLAADGFEDLGVESVGFAALVEAGLLGADPFVALLADLGDLSLDRLALLDLRVDERLTLLGPHRPHRY